VNTELLNEHFGKSLIKKRRGAFGQNLSYVEGAEYIRRLNDAFDNRWSFEVVEHHIRPDEVIVIGKLTADGVAKMAFGGSAVTVSRSGQTVSVADDLKSAATDALKKAATLLGVGLHLYGSDSQVATRTVRGPETALQQSSGNGNGHRSPNGGNGQQIDRITQRQLSALRNMGRGLGQSAEQIRQRSVDVFGVVPEQLSKADASAFITELGEALSGGAR